MSSIEHTGTCIVGAGVIGLAIARKLASIPRFQREGIVIIEENSRPGQGTSSRNSEVIHAGLYYPADSQKAALCVRGKALLYEYLEARGLPYRRLGKLVVGSAGSSDSDEKLEALQQQARANGVNDTKLLSIAQTRDKEGALSDCFSLYSPSSGIFDSHAFMESLLFEAETQGAVLAANSTVAAISRQQGEFQLHCQFTDKDGSRADFDLRSARLVNAAGLQALDLAARIDGLAAQQLPRLYPCKGNYLKFNGKNPFSHLIYPLPEPGLRGLGIHATLDLQGQLRFGPNTRYLDQPLTADDYRVDPGLEEQFAAAIARYFPAISANALSPDYVGIRPKLAGPDGGVSDFLIQQGNADCLPGLVQLFGIESPGLTASLAIAERVAELVD